MPPKKRRKRKRPSKKLTQDSVIQIIQVAGGLFEVAIVLTRLFKKIIKKTMKGEPVDCSDCGTSVYPEDPYFATPCGTFCSKCMRKHVKQCEVCKNEFDL